MANQHIDNWRTIYKYINDEDELKRILKAEVLYITQQTEFISRNINLREMEYEKESNSEKKTVIKKDIAKIKILLKEIVEFKEYLFLKYKYNNIYMDIRENLKNKKKEKTEHAKRIFEKLSPTEKIQKIKIKCNENKDCKNNQKCTNNICVECNENKDCKYNQRCKNNICVETGNIILSTKGKNKKQSSSILKKTVSNSGPAASKKKLNVNI
jgi:hypothetical protein